MEKKRIAATAAFLLSAVFMIIMTVLSLNRYLCMTEHYPEKYVQVQVYEDPADHSRKPSEFDRGKAVYRRRYIYNNVYYRTKISREEFDDTFYVCEGNPSKMYSQTDLEHPGKYILMAVMLAFGGIVSLGAGVIILVRKKEI